MCRRRRPSLDEHGIALIATLLLLLLLAVIGAAGLTYSALDLKSTAHYETGNQALYSAEAGLEHALSIINDIGVNDFNQDIVQRWSTVFGTAARTIPGYPSFSYQVPQPVVYPTDLGCRPTNCGTITAYGYAPLQAQRVIQARVRRRGFGGNTGAIHLASDEVHSDFSGNSFFVDGNDHDIFGNANPAGPIRPGISTRNSDVTGEVVHSLNTDQKDNVRGLGFSLAPLTPSVMDIGGPGRTDLDRNISQVLSRPNVFADSTHVFNNGTTSTFGTLQQPQITRLTDTDVTVNGNITGCGILIADGSLTINGTIDFVGWIIVRGSTTIHTQTSNDGTTVLGAAVIRGSLWTADFDVEVGGTAIVDYCDACLSIADAIGGGNNVPRSMQVVSWGEQ
jgi:hypothetical protein